MHSELNNFFQPIFIESDCNEKIIHFNIPAVVNGNNTKKKLVYFFVETINSNCKKAI